VIGIRSDGRLGLAIAKGPALDHICPICDGEGDRQGCYCDGVGVITADQARELAADDPDPRWSPRPLPPVPAYTGQRCADCAFRPNSLERDGATARELFMRLERRNEGAPFYCHAGMHDGAKGYVPRQRDAHGMPIGHPICAGWVREFERWHARWTK
jgi:hypothetical protein